MELPVCEQRSVRKLPGCIQIYTDYRFMERKKILYSSYGTYRTLGLALQFCYKSSDQPCLRNSSAGRVRDVAQAYGDDADLVRGGFPAIGVEEADEMHQMSCQHIPGCPGEVTQASSEEPPPAISSQLRRSDYPRQRAKILNSFKSQGFP
jgi:hypothetical protein